MNRSVLFLGLAVVLFASVSTAWDNGSNMLRSASREAEAVCMQAVGRWQELETGGWSRSEAARRQYAVKYAEVRIACAAGGLAKHNYSAPEDIRALARHPDIEAEAVRQLTIR